MGTILNLFYNSPIETGGTNALTGQRSGVMVEPTPWSSSHGTYNVDDTVSSSGTAYACNTQHTAGATLAADSSKWNSLGSCSPAPILAVGTVYTLYFRTLDSVTGADPGLDSTSNVIFTPPANTQVCQTYNGTFTGSALQLSVAATGGNQPVYVKQTASASSSPVQLLVGALSWAAGSRVAQVGTVTATPGDSTVTLSWADISGETGYEVDRATDSGFTANLVHLTTSLAANSTGYVNNSGNGNAPVNGTTYYYRVRGVNANGVGAWSSGVSATLLTAVTTLTSISNDAAVTLTWAVPSITPDHYVIRRATNVGMSTNLVTLSSSVTGATTSYINNSGNGNAPTNETAYYYDIVPADAGGNITTRTVSTVVVPGTYCFYNNFAAGDSLNSTYLDSSVTGTGGSATVASNLWTIKSLVTADAAIGRFKNAIDKTKRRRYKVKVRCTAAVDTAQPRLLFGVNAASLDATENKVGVLSGLVGETFGMTFNNTTTRWASISYYYNITNATLWRSGNQHGYQNQWADLAADNNGDDQPPLALSTYYYAVLEHDSVGFVIELRDASDVLITRTSKVAWSGNWSRTKASVNTNPIFLHIGEIYTDYWYSTLEVASIKVEGLAADIS